MDESQGKIIIMDSDGAMSNLLQDFLHHEGYQITCFSITSDAFHTVGQGDGDLTILEYRRSQKGINRGSEEQDDIESEYYKA